MKTIIYSTYLSFYPKNLPELRRSLWWGKKKSWCWGCGSTFYSI